MDLKALAQMLIVPVVASAVATLVNWLLNRDARERQRSMERELKQMGDERLANVEEDLKTAKLERAEQRESDRKACEAKHRELEVSTRLLERVDATVKGVSSGMNRMEGKIETLLTEVASLQTGRAAQDRWLQNLNDSHQNHVTDRGLHHRG